MSIKNIIGWALGVLLITCFVWVLSEVYGFTHVIQALGLAIGATGLILLSLYLIIDKK